jgi:hypothetical protein
MVRSGDLSLRIVKQEENVTDLSDGFRVDGALPFVPPCWTLKLFLVEHR